MTQTQDSLNKKANKKIKTKKIKKSILITDLVNPGHKKGMIYYHPRKEPIKKITKKKLQRKISTKNLNKDIEISFYISAFSF